MHVFEVHQSFTTPNGAIHPTGGSAGTLYLSLAEAQASIPGAVWTKRERNNQWDSQRRDIITRRAVIQNEV